MLKTPKVLSQCVLFPNVFSQQHWMKGSLVRYPGYDKMQFQISRNFQSRVEKASSVRRTMAMNVEGTLSRGKLLMDFREDIWVDA